MSIIQGHAKSSGVTSFYPTTIDQSLRFEDGDSAYLSRTLTTPTDQQTFTYSVWLKRGTLTPVDTEMLLGSGASNSNRTHIYFDSTDKLVFLNTASSVNTVFLQTSAVYRDVSSWYHVVVVGDFSNATQADRVQMYVNGVRITAFDTNTIPSNTITTTYINSANLHGIGRRTYADAQRYDGYMAEVHFTDGTAYDADDFGELKSGIWVPKSPSVTYGTNGFYLDFANSADIGNDVSGNGNDWTVNNLVASDVVLDSPTNNFAVFNPLHFKGTGSRTLLEGNLRNNTSTTGSAQTYGSLAMSSGKRYWEIYINSIGVGAHFIGIAKQDSAFDSNQVSYRSDNGNKMIDGTATAYGTSYTTGQIIGVAYNADDDEITFYEDNVSQGTISISGYGGVDVFPVIQDESSTAINCTVNFGQDSTFAGNETAGGNSDANGIGDFKYAPPSGYLALCTANLPDPVIDPAQDATPEDHFNVLTWTGDGVSPRSLTGVGFQPDFTWIKHRSGTAWHILTDVVRGVNRTLFSNDTNQEVTNENNGYVSSFDSDGFTVTTGAGTFSNANTSGQTYVAWNWKAGGSGVSNTDGTITSTVSANTDAGFSVVTYDGEASNTTTVGHGLSSAPEMIIVKSTTDGDPWIVYGKTLGNTKYLSLNSNAGENSTYAVWNNTSPTASVFTVSYVSGGYGAVNYPSRSYVAYCFHSVDGFSKVGSYIGNGSADGPFVYTGFRPKWVMTKESSDTSQWHINDSERDLINPCDLPISANDSVAEPASTTQEIDFLSNGFKLRNSGSGRNTSGNTYIYLAFAEQPFKYSNAR